jgi:hypothetical protein
MPGSKMLAKVSPKYRTPVAAIWTGAALESLFVWGASLVSIGEAGLRRSSFRARSSSCSCRSCFRSCSACLPTERRSGQDGPVEPRWRRFKAWACWHDLGMILIIYIGVQPPNDKAWASPSASWCWRRRLVHAREKPLQGTADRRHRSRARRNRGGREAAVGETTLLTLCRARLSHTTINSKGPHPRPRFLAQRKCINGAAKPARSMPFVAPISRSMDMGRSI